MFPSQVIKTKVPAPPVASHPRNRVLFPSLLAVALLFSPVAIDAATITVTSNLDDGTGTLRQAILIAASGDTINFSAGLATIDLTSGELLINKSLTISGPGANLLTVRRSVPAGGTTFRIFDIAAGNSSITISGLTIAKGWALQDRLGGGGILVRSGNAVTITNSIFSDNISAADRTAQLQGGGISNMGAVTVTNSTISGNITDHFGGGGIYNAAGGMMTITNSTISGNITHFENGAGINNSGTMTITNSTISGNSAGEEAGGGIFNVGTLTMMNITVCYNTSYGGSPGGGGNGIYNHGGTVNGKNCIIAANGDVRIMGSELDFTGTLTSQGYNLIGTDAGLTINPAAGDQIGTFASPIDPKLGPLQDNGGPTFTHAPFDGSPAIDKGGTGINSDQRGRPRPVRYNASIPEPAGGDGSDIGAVELSPVQFDVRNYSVAENGGSVSVSVTRSGDTSQSASVHYATSDGTATAGSDYTGASGDLVFASGETNKTIAIQVLDDSTYEGDEAFTVTLSSAAGADLGLSAATVTIVENDPAPRSLNISSRSQVQTGDNVMIGGFIITGKVPKPVVLRGLGPSLVRAGIPAATVLNDPVLELRGASGALITSNDNWKDSPQKAQIEGTVFQPSDDREAVVLATLPPAGYTAVVRGKDGSSGVGLVEIYDVDQSGDSTLANISTRALAATGNDVLIGGFILGGANGSVTIIVRAIGPSLAQSGVSGPLPDPLLELRDGNGMLIGFNDNWKDDPGQASQLTQAGLQPQSDLESAIAAELPPGMYTAVVSGKNGSTGVGLVEVYNLQ